MKIIDKINDLNGYIYVIEFETHQKNTGKTVARRVDVKCVTETIEPYYYIMDPGVYYLDKNNEPVFVESNIEETQMLNHAIELIQSAG